MPYKCYSEIWERKKYWINSSIVACSASNTWTEVVTVVKMLMIYLLPWFHIHSKLVSFWVNCIWHIQQKLFNTGYHHYWQPWLLLTYTNWRSCQNESLILGKNWFNNGQFQKIFIPHPPEWGLEFARGGGFFPGRYGYFLELRKAIMPSLFVVDLLSCYLAKCNAVQRFLVIILWYFGCFFVLLNDKSVSWSNVQRW